MLDYFALFLVFFVSVFLFYGIIVLHDIPYEIAKKRKHPHKDAIHVAGWVSLFTLHAIWPFLWIWAMLHDPDYGWRKAHVVVEPAAEGEQEDLRRQVDALRGELGELRARLDAAEAGEA